MEQCYLRIEQGRLYFGNEKWERAIQMDSPRPMSLYLWDRVTGKRWEGSQQVSLFCLDPLEQYVSTVHSRKVGKDGLRVILQCMGSSHMVEISFLLFDDSPFFSTRLYVCGNLCLPQKETEAAADGNENAVVVKHWEEPIVPETDSVEAFGLQQRHMEIQITSLRDVTDRYNNLVEEKQEWLYRFGRQTYYGDLFRVTDQLDGTGLTVVREAPCRGARLNQTGPDVVIYPEEYLCVRGSGLDCGVLDEAGDFCYGTAIGFCTGEQALEEYKKFYRRVCRTETYVMSNTWGDRNQDTAVCDAFIRREIDCAADLGIDIVQIDDGWQKGVTANSKLKQDGAWGSYYDVMPDFWTVNLQKFPEGLEPICAYAQEKGVRLALWFSPDATDSYARWEKDAQTMIQLYRSYKIASFKLDGIHLKDKRGDRNLRRMVEMVKRETEGAVDFNFDITAQVRWGYFYQKQYGTLFVENRYTDWGNYFPHDTLRNLWDISRFVPAQRLQMEVLNPKRNRQNYQGDPYAPANYPMDYLFGIAMVAHPLLWMEMSGLEQEDFVLLKKVISVYKKVRSGLQSALITPVGERPSGESLTGFYAQNEGESYLLVFREMTSRDQMTYSLPGVPCVIYGDVTAEKTKDGVRVQWKKCGSFGLIKLKPE